MADEGAPAEDTQVSFHVKSSSDAKYNLTLPLSTTIADLKSKLSSSEYADVPSERLRLIYSGRVLKDPDTLASIKIKEGNTIHLVKSAASNVRQNPAAQSSGSTTTGTTPPAVPTMAAGTGNSTLAGLTGARYAGFHQLPGADTFGPDGGMSGGIADPDQLLRMMENPMFVSQMNEAMNNPAVIEMMQQSPMIRNNPFAQQMLRNPEFRRTLMNPDVIRMQLQMQRAMNGGSNSSFPAPGATNTTPEGQASTTTGGGTTATPNQPDTTGSTSPPPNPFAFLGGMGQGQPGNTAANPFAALFGAPPAQPQASTTPTTQGTSDTGTTNTTTAPDNAAQANPFAGLFGSPPPASAGAQQNPFAPANLMQSPFFQQQMQAMMQNPEAMQAAMNMILGGGGAGQAPGSNNSTGAGSPTPVNPFSNLFPGVGDFGGMSPAAPVDNRPPEERYAEQLRQLNEMGFYEFERNVQALRRSGGSVQGAVEYLLSGN